MPENLPTINLAANKKSSGLDQFINWVLTTGRLIIIITEVVAVAAFLYRFSLDESIANINTDIKQKQNFVTLLKKDENKYRNFQNRIALASEFSKKTGDINSIITYIFDLTAQGLDISTFSFNKDRITLAISASSIAHLKTFIDPIQQHPQVQSVSVDNIENKQFIGLIVTMTIILK
jgi:hypothetical protein